MRVLFLLALFVALLLPLPARALDLTVGPQPLQHALLRQLFSAPDGRYYLRGDRNSACYLFAQNPQLQFSGNRIELALHLEGRLGSSFGGQCIGFKWSGEAGLSMLPQAQDQQIGFTDVRVEHLTGDNGLDQLLGSVLSARVPANLKVNAASLIDKMLRSASTRSGETITLDHFTIPAMNVQNNALHLSVEGNVTIQ